MTTAIEDVVRTIVIRARRETVFRFFTDNDRWASWWGAGSTIEPRPGGRVQIVHPGNQRASGTVKEIVPGERIAFTYGYEGAGKPIPPGGSTVILVLADDPGGTRVTLRHTDIPSVEAAREHVQGWRFQLSLFSNVVAALEHAAAHTMADQWFAAWGEPDAGRRRALLDACTASDVVFHDPYSALFGRDDVEAHLAAVAIHMPGVRMARHGDVALSHGAGLVRWEARKGDGVAGKGSNLFDFAPDGRIARVVGFWEK